MRGCVLLALAALFVSAEPAVAADVKTHGLLVVRWHSNPATCAEHGMCDRSGVLSWRPDAAYASFDLVDRNFGFLSLFGSRAVARSYRASEVCVDEATAPSDIVTTPSRNAIVFSMRSMTELGFGRCAGPLGSDFAAALPESPPITVASLRRGALIDLRARSPFSSGPFEGEVISTLTVRTEAARRPDRGQSASGPLPGSHVVRFGRVSASYAVDSLSGDAGYALSGAGNPECGPFDTCGLTGELMLHPDLRRGTVGFESIRRLPTGRETVVSGLRALRRGRARGFGDGRLGPGFDPDVDAEPPPVAIPLTETVTPGGGATCSDTGSYVEPSLRIERRRAGFAISLAHGGNSEPDPLRTRCPGPGSDDVGALVRATLPLSALGQQRIELTLRPGPGFAAAGVRGSGRGELKLSLRLTSLRASTRRIRIERGGFFD